MYTVAEYVCVFSHLFPHPQRVGVAERVLLTQSVSHYIHTYIGREQCWVGRCQLRSWQRSGSQQPWCFHQPAGAIGAASVAAGHVCVTPTRVTQCVSNTPSWCPLWREKAVWRAAVVLVVGVYLPSVRGVHMPMCVEECACQA